MRAVRAFLFCLQQSRSRRSPSGAHWTRREADYCDWWHRDRRRARHELPSVGIGLVGAFALTRVMSALLFNTNPLDVLTFASSAAVLLLIAVLSSYLPARRALRIDPTIAMRTE
jgi:hypothetical protein